MREFWIVYGIINAITFFVYGLDKMKAQAGAYRIPEKVLITMALFGPIGGFLGMKLFRHKTRKNKFRILVPTFLVMHLMVGFFATNVYGAEGPSSWAEDEYNRAVEKGYITDDLTTNLQDPITRLEFVELVMQSYEKVVGKITTVTEDYTPFTDTGNSYAIKAHKMGIVSGVTDNKFEPHTSINREQLVVIFIRMNNVIEEESSEVVLSDVAADLSYGDVSEISSWAVDSLALGVSNELISGVGGNLLSPKASTSREQAILINLRLMEKYETNENLFVEEVNKTTLKEESETVAETNTKSIVSMDGEIGVITTEILNMRSEPDTTSADTIIRKLYFYEQVELLNKEGDWYHIMASGNVEGYAHSDYVKIYEPLANQSEVATSIIEYAKQFQGTRYQYAGTSLTGGIDCSSYTQQVMAPYGISLNRSSAGQYLNGVSISKEDLEPGDLIYYGYSGSISHVAIYIGNSQVIHANTTYGVSITPAFGWMNKPVIGYRRVIL